MFRNHTSLHRQQGSMLMIAIFILVILGLLGAAFSAMYQSSQTSVGYEVLGIRAQAAANAGAEVGLYRIIRQSQSCAVMTTGSTIPTTSLSVSLDTSEAALTQCSVAVKCGQRAAVSGSSYTFYVLTSVATCTAGGSLSVTRSVRSEVKK